MRVITIPYYSKTQNIHKETILKAIKILSEQYDIDCEYMNPQSKIEWLETITNLVDIYLYMED